MTTRIHTADRKYVNIRYVHNPAGYFRDEEMAVGPALVITDWGNDEAFVIVGSPKKIAKLLRQALLVLRELDGNEQERELHH